MSLVNLYEIAGSALTAQSVRLNAVASNLANAGSAGTTAEAAYKPIQPIFEAVYDQTLDFGSETDLAARVKVKDLHREETGDEQMRYQPTHPMSNEEGYVFYPNINVVEQMADMLSASRSYQTNLEVMVTARKLQQRLLALGQ
ncbi:flagellar basal body rod protein FlgC [Endozoicomonas sp. Mp262]|uniref:flagellar basal body rod protein FlgC n=1 Tax=Endozoicomonas sp. Mp262 TaxID=2919499 RepID=UPI0021D91399